MNSIKILPCGALAVGSLFGLAGIVFAVMYVSEAVIARLGEADQSLLFWYLPILFIGLFGIIIGAAIGFWGFVCLREIRQQGSSQGFEK